MSKDNRDMPVCPECKKTDQVVPIVYGYPSPALSERAISGEVQLGGCIIENDTHYCKRDEIAFVAEEG